MSESYDVLKEMEAKVRAQQTIDALLISALPVNQARQILRDLGYYSKAGIDKAMPYMAEGDHITGNVLALRDMISWINYCEEDIYHD